MAQREHCNIRAMAMRTCILILMESDTLSGPARNLLESADLLRNEFLFSFVTFVRGRQTSTEFIEAIRAAGFEAHILREAFRYDARAANALGALVRELRPDVLQVHNTKSRLYAYLLRKSGRIREIPQVDFFHGETWVDPKQMLYNRLDRWLFRQSRHVVTMCHAQKRLLASWGIEPSWVQVIYNGVRAVDVPSRAPSEKPVILSVGRLSREKGHEILLRAVRRLVDEGHREFKLLVVGDGPERARLERYAQQEKLDPYVEFRGYDPNPEPYYEQADLFVLPSLTEGLPNVLLEAAVRSIPIVSFDVGGIPEVLENGREAVLLGEHTPEALASAIMAFLSSPSRYADMAQNARDRVRRDFSIEKRAATLGEYYRKLIASGVERS